MQKTTIKNTINYNMNKIKKLPIDQIQKIAAGEVVERPANIVKELIENALDAGATQVTLHLEDAGKKLIRVVDNGVGMSESDALLSFEHHATSKLTSIDDLETLATFGFRGEALSSIASVSHAKLITKQKDNLHGTQLVYEGGVLQTRKVVSSACGTDITIADLFFNVPARKKFLKKRETEWRQINMLMHAFCLSNCGVHFKVISEGNQVINCPATDLLETRIQQLKQFNIARHILPLTHKDTAVEITGAISDHTFFKYDRSGIFFFVNGRWVRNHILTKVVLKGYQNVLPDGRYPFVALFIEIDSNEIDINIHPRKEEIKFLHPRHVETAVTTMVKTTLEKNIATQLKQTQVIPSVPLETKSKSSFVGTPSFAHHLNAHGYNDTAQKYYSHQITHQADQPVNLVPPIVQTQQDRISSMERSYTLIGQFKKTYIVLEKEEGLFIVDQHAAQERIFLNQFNARSYKDNAVALLFPQTVLVPEDQLTLLTHYLHLFKDNGVDVEPFGNDQVIIQATPVHLKHLQWSNIIHQCIAWIQEYEHLDTQEFEKILHDKLHAQMACKAAVKAGDTLTTEQMYELLDTLEKTENRMICAHGRPTCWLLQMHDIEKKFKRKK